MFDKSVLTNAKVVFSTLLPSSGVSLYYLTTFFGTPQRSRDVTLTFYFRFFCRIFYVLNLAGVPTVHALARLFCLFSYSDIKDH